MNAWKAMVSGVLLLASGSLQGADERASCCNMPDPEPGTLVMQTQPGVTHEILHRLTTQIGYGPENSVLGNDDKIFYRVRYEPTFIGYSDEKLWAKWMLFGRAWLSYDSPSQSNTDEGGGYDDSGFRKPEYDYAELRELYIQRNLIGDDPRFSATLGRQRFYDDYGIWWDDSIESARFNYTDTFSKGFVAVARKFYTYNTDGNTLDPRDEKITYLFGEYGVRWSANNWLGARFMREDDRSGHDPEDPKDFKGLRTGLYFKGDNLNLPISDYHFEFARIRGDVDVTDGRGTERHKVKGWAAIGEVGKRFHDLPYTPRVALYAGITDKPDGEYSGFNLNRIQSDRVIRPSSYSTRLTSSFVRVNLYNLKYVGVALQANPTPRSSLDFRVSSLYMRDANSDLPIYVDSEQRRARSSAIRLGQHSSGKSLGQVVDAGYYWKMFPVAYDGRHINMNGLFNVSYFRAGSAIKRDNELQISVNFSVNF